MSYLKTALEIIVAFFAVIGLYFSVRILLQKFFCTRKLVLTLEILTEADARDSEMLIREALSGFWLISSGRLLVVTTPALQDHPVLSEMIVRYGLEYYTLMPEPEKDGNETGEP